MKVISQSIIKDLISDKSGDCISLYMPITDVISGREDVLRLKNLLSQLGKEAEPTKQIKPLLNQVYQLFNDSSFWRRPGKGLALFYSPTISMQIRTSSAFREIALYSTSFFITPLLPLVSENISFSVLVLSQRKVRILEGDMYDYQQKDIIGLPENLEKALWYRDSERVGQRANSASGSSHGQAENLRQPNVELTEYLQLIIKSLQPYLNNIELPLILAGPEPLQGIFRKICRYRQVFEKGIPGNQDRINNDDIYRIARKIAKPIAHQRINRALRKLTDTQGSQPDRITLDPAKIIQQARAGRVHTLLCRSALEHNAVEVFGEYVQSNASSTSIYEDLIDQAARHTLLSGGQVISVSPHQLPSIAAAVLRY